MVRTCAIDGEGIVVASTTQMLIAKIARMKNIERVIVIAVKMKLVRLRINNAACCSVCDDTIFTLPRYGPSLRSFATLKPRCNYRPYVFGSGSLHFLAIRSQ